MVSKEDILNQIKEQTFRLLKKELHEDDIRPIIMHFIEGKLPDEVYTDITKKYGAKSFAIGLIYHPALFENENIIQLIFKMIGIMEISETWKEYERLSNKKPKDKPLTDFDKILKGILQVPKPKEKPSE